MKKFLVMLAALVAMSLVAGPAFADDTPADAGVVRDGNAVVGKGIYGAGCSSNPTGGGIGFPILTSTAGKDAYYRFEGAGTSVLHGAGNMTVCGDLHPDITGLGASCGLSSSDNGHGTANFGTSNVVLSGLGWAQSAGSAFVVTGDADVNGAEGEVVALVSAKGAVPDCSTKGNGKTSQTAFFVDIVFTIVEGV